MGTPTDPAAKGCTGVGRSSHRTSAKIVRASVNFILAHGVLGYCALAMSLRRCLCVCPQSEVSEPRVYIDPTRWASPTNSCSFNLYISGNYSDGIGDYPYNNKPQKINKERSENYAVYGSMPLKVVLDIVIHGV